MALRASQLIAVLEREYQITVEARAGSHRKLRRDGFRAYTLPCPQAGKTQISDGYLKAMCSQLGIDEARLREQLGMGPRKGVKKAASIDAQEQPIEAQPIEAQPIAAMAECNATAIDPEFEQEYAELERAEAAAATSAETPESEAAAESVDAEPQA